MRRAALDQVTLSHIMTWLPVITDNFNDQDIVVPIPKLLKEEDKINVNPNDTEQISIGCNASCFMNT